MAICPVCKNESNDSNVCEICGFDQVGKVFINRNDAEEWLRTVVEPYRENQGFYKAINYYFSYAKLSNRLQLQPDDFVCRSTLLEELLQVYIYKKHYPFPHLPKLNKEINHHIDYFEKANRRIGSITLEHLCNSFDIRKAEMSLSDGELLKALIYYINQMRRDVFKQSLYLINKGESYFAVNNEDIYYILSNVMALCKIINRNRFSSLLCKYIDQINIIRGKVNDIAKDAEKRFISLLINDIIKEPFVYTDINFADKSILYLFGLQHNIQSPMNSFGLNNRLSRNGSVASKNSYQRFDINSLYSLNLGIYDGGMEICYYSDNSFTISNVTIHQSLMLTEEDMTVLFDNLSKLLALFNL